MNNLNSSLSVVLQPSLHSSEEFLAALSSLDELAKDRSLDGKLRHYLERRSYEKAKAFIEQAKEDN